MTTCVTDLMQQGWEIMQQKGISQCYGLVATAKNGKIWEACALGAIYLAVTPEDQWITKGELRNEDAEPLLSTACPALQNMITTSDPACRRKVYDVIWNMNDGWLYPHNSRSMSIPEIIQHLKDRGF